MALINCPECNKQISDFAVNCPSCGYPMQKQNFANKTTPSQKRNISQNYTGLPPATPKPVGCFKISLIVVGCTFALFLLLGLLATIFDSTDSNSKPLKSANNTVNVNDSISLDSLPKNDTTIKGFASTSAETAKKQTDVTKAKETTVKKSAPAKQAKPKRKSRSSRTYYTGPRGGCYYINSNGNKTYVDRSFCN